MDTKATDVSINISQADTVQNTRAPRHDYKHTIKKYLVGFASRMALVLIYLIIVIAILIAIEQTVSFSKYDYAKTTFPWKYDPRTQLTPMDPNFGPYNILLDAHSHTTSSDGKLKPEQLVDRAISNGYNAIAVTDHQTVAGGLKAMKYAQEKYPNQIVVIPGMEYTCCRLHMNLLNIEENIKVVKDFPTDEDLKNVIDKTHALGGLVIVNHIWWSNATNQSHRTVLTDHPSREKLLELGVDGFEVINSNVFDLPTYQFVLENKDKLVGVSGSDIHSPDVPSYAWTILNAAGFNRSAIMDQLKAKKTSYLFDPTGSPYLPEFSISSRYYKLSMLNDIVQLLYSFRYYDHGTYSFRGSFCQPSITQVYAQMVGWGIFYLILVFLFFEVFRGIAYGLWHLSRNLVARLKSARKRRNTNHIQ